MTSTPLTLTPAALERLRALMAQRARPATGVRIGIKTKGCSGLSYALEYVEEVNPLDEAVSLEDMTIYIEPKALLFILGTEMDYVVEELKSGFVFRNPNEKGRCGCGKSFHV